MQARTTREPLVPSYVLTSISLLFLSPFRSTPPLSLFFSYPAILLTPVQSYLSSVSVPISDFYHSLSLYTVLFCSPFLSENFARSSVLRSFSLFPTRSSFFIPSPPPPPHFFRLSLLFSRYLPRLLSSCPCSLFCPSFFIFRSFLPISSSRIFIIVLLLSRSSTSPTIGVFPLPTLSSPTLSVYLARFASPAGHPQSSFSFSRLLSPFNRCFVFLSFSLSYFELRRSTYIFLGQSPSSSHNATSSFATCLPCSPKRARGGSTHHRLIHDYYHLIRPPAFFIVPFTKHEPGRARNIFCLWDARKRRTDRFY